MTPPLFGGGQQIEGHDTKIEILIHFFSRFMLFHHGVIVSKFTLLWVLKLADLLSYGRSGLKVPGNSPGGALVSPCFP